MNSSPQHPISFFSLSRALSEFEEERVEILVLWIEKGCGSPTRRERARANLMLKIELGLGSGSGDCARLT